MSLSSSKSSPLRHRLAPAREIRSVRTTISTAVVILILSLAAWLYFYVDSVPLNAAETTVVVGLIALIVVLAKWVWTKKRASGNGRRS
jgi:Na+/proline symporter